MRRGSTRRIAAVEAVCGVDNFFIRSKLALGAAVSLTALMIGLQASAQDAVIDVNAASGEGVEAGDVVIDGEQLEFSAPATLPDLFAGESAVNVGGVIASGAKTYVHSVEEQNLNVTIDGVRQGSGGWHHSGNLLLDPELLKAVTIKPGVAAADDGPGALAGTIAYETKDARDLLEPGQELGGYGKIEWRSNGNSFKETAALYGAQGGLEFLLSGSLHDGDDYEDGAGRTVTYTGPDQYSLLGKFAINGADQQRIETSFEMSEDSGDRNFRNNITITDPAFPLARNAVVPFTTSRSTFTLSYADESPNEFITPSAEFGYNRSVFDSEETNDGGGSAVMAGRLTTFNGKINGDVDVGYGVLSIGADFQHDESTGDTATTVVFGPAPADYPEYTESRRNLGGYAQARLQPSDLIGLSFGGRIDQQWFIGARGEKFDDNGLSGNATLELSPLDWLTLSAGYSHVWGGYTFAETALIGFGGAVPDYTGFTATTSDNIRIGGEVASNGFSAGVYVFRTTIDDANDRDRTARGASADLETEGVDVKLGYRGEAGFVTAKYTYTDVSENGAEPAPNNYYHVAPGGHIFALQAGYQPFPGFTLGGDAEIALDYDEMADAGVGAALPGYEVVGFFAEYDVESLPGLTLRADVDNIFDEDYFRHTADGAGLVGGTGARHEPGRSFGLSAKMQF